VKNGESDITEKVYPYQKMSAAKIVLGEIAVWFLFFLFYVMWVSMGSAPSFITLIIALFLVLYPILAILLLLSPIILTMEIVIDKQGILFKRRFRPIVIQKVTDLKTREFRGKEVNITITGLTPDGKEVRKRVARAGGRDVGKKWGGFKADLQKIKSK